MAFLTDAQLQKEQASAEGFQLGPQPALNPQNLNTQIILGNNFSVVPPSPVPAYYPGADKTPNLQLSLNCMEPEMANNMVLIDAFVGNSVNQIGQGGITPFVTGTVQDHSCAFCAYAGSGSTFTENDIAFARFTISAPISISYIAGKITDGAAGSNPFGKFAIYSADGQTLITATKFQIGTAQVGLFSSAWTNAPVLLPAGSYILAWSACGETVAGAAKMTGLVQNTLTAIANYALSTQVAGQVAIGSAAGQVLPPLYNFPATIGNLTQNNNYTIMPLVYLTL